MGTECSSKKQTKYLTRQDCKIEYYAAIRNHVAEDC